MGDYTIRIHAVGGHGCQREVKHGGTLKEDCGSPNCPDCMTRRFVNQLKTSGNHVKVAHLTHWPAELETYSGQDLSEVRDNLLTNVRRGSF